MTAFANSYLLAAEKTLPQFATVQTAKKIDIMVQYLAERGAKMNLTSITDGDAVLWLHVIDSLYAAAEIQKSGAGNIADVGSGGGFPALVIAASLSDVQVTAIDSTAKKCEYISSCAEKMGLSDVRTLSVRAEEYGSGDGRGAFDGVCARAVASLPVLCELCLPLVRVGGYFFSMKGVTAFEEEKASRRAVKTLGAELCETVSYTLPSYADERHILIYRKTSETPSAYPRKYAKITKNPL